MKKLTLLLLLSIMALPMAGEAKFNNLCQADSASDKCKQASAIMYRGTMQAFVNKTMELRKKAGQEVDVKAVQQEALDYMPYKFFVSTFNQCGETKTTDEEIGKCMMASFGNRAVEVISKKYQKTK